MQASVQMNRSGDEEAGRPCSIRCSSYSTFDTQRRPLKALRLIRRRSVLVLGWRLGGTLNSKRTTVFGVSQTKRLREFGKGILSILHCLERLVRVLVNDHDAYRCQFSGALYTVLGSSLEVQIASAHRSAFRIMANTNQRHHYGSFRSVPRPVNDVDPTKPRSSPPDMDYYMNTIVTGARKTNMGKTSIVRVVRA
jgi:hypothetical protein